MFSEFGRDMVQGEGSDQLNAGSRRQKPCLAQLVATVHRERSGATAAENGSSRRPTTSLRRFGENIPSKLRPRRACVRFLSLDDIARTSSKSHEAMKPLLRLILSIQKCLVLNFQCSLRYRNASTASKPLVLKPRIIRIVLQLLRKDQLLCCRLYGDQIKVE